MVLDHEHTLESGIHFNVVPCQITRFSAMSNGFRFSLQRLFRSSKSSVESDALLTLQELDAFSHMSGNSLRDLAEVMHFRDYRAKEYLYHEEDPALGLYILQRGSVRLSKLDRDGDSYEIKILSDNAMFGEESLMGDRTRFESAQVISDSRLIGFFKPDLDTLLHRLPNLGVEVIQALADRIAEKQEMLLKKVVSFEDGMDLVKSTYNLD